MKILIRLYHTPAHKSTIDYSAIAGNGIKWSCGEILIFKPFAIQNSKSVIFQKYIEFRSACDTILAIEIIRFLAK